MIRYFVCSGCDVLVAEEGVWRSIDPILFKGDYAVSFDTKVIKIGDGVRSWSSL